MSLPTDLSLYAIGTLGHVAVCVSALNRIQGSVAEHSVEKVLKRGVYGWALFTACVNGSIGRIYHAMVDCSRTTSHKLGVFHVGNSLVGGNGNETNASGYCRPLSCRLETT